MGQLGLGDLHAQLSKAKRLSKHWNELLDAAERESTAFREQGSVPPEVEAVHKDLQEKVSKINLEISELKQRVFQAEKP